VQEPPEERWRGRLDVPRKRETAGRPRSQTALAFLTPLLAGLAALAGLWAAAEVTGRPAILETGAFLVAAGCILAAAFFAAPLGPGNRDHHTTWTAADHPRGRPALAASLRLALVAAPATVYVAVQIVRSV
jgi:hypothetical protein